MNAKEFQDLIDTIRNSQMTYSQKKKLYIEAKLRIMGANPFKIPALQMPPKLPSMADL